MQLKLNDFKEQKESMSALYLVGLLIRRRLMTSSIPGSIQTPSIPKKHFKYRDNSSAHGPNPVADALAVLRPSLFKCRESFSEHYRDIYGIDPSVITANSSSRSFVQLAKIHGSFKLYLPLDLKSERDWNYEQLQYRVALLISKAADAKVCKELEELDEIVFYADQKKIYRRHR
ncbi:uncharacterized protein EAF01_007264 [Botrytis porri]|uniref:uncharacterized protein n=1 Tax=Botrytis porri TaxID=87229 RepID=UPI0019018346|nr:uncharacterized protein EAF01_007264 [Botrytis porri]KAF7901966.1 hypothetical protein EAF01_007264 [Botrytis porri]